MKAGATLEDVEKVDMVSPTTKTAQTKPRVGPHLVDAEERQLLVRHRQGDPKAFAELVDEYRRPVYSYLARCAIDPTDRDDLFQEVFVKIHRAAESYEAHRPLQPWIFTIVANTVRTHLRGKRIRQLVFAASAQETATEPPDPAPDGQRRSEARQALALLEQEIRRLPLAQREVVLLATLEKRPLGEVAGVLDIPLGTVKTHLRRARLALARALTRRDRGGGISI